MHKYKCNVNALVCFFALFFVWHSIYYLFMCVCFVLWFVFAFFCFGLFLTFYVLFYFDLLIWFYFALFCLWHSIYLWIYVLSFGSFVAFLCFPLLYVFEIVSSDFIVCSVYYFIHQQYTYGPLFVDLVWISIMLGLRLIPHLFSHCGHTETHGKLFIMGFPAM